MNGQTEISLPSPAIRFSFVGHKRRFYHSCLEVDGLGSPASSGSDKVSERAELTAEGERNDKWRLSCFLFGAVQKSTILPRCL